MRKTLIALILVLPMVFVLVIFTSVNAVSLGVDIAVSGITIRAEGTDENGTLFIDMADRTAHTVSAEVSPGNATEKGYTLTSSDPTLVDVTKDGVIVPKKEGTAQITAKSNDKSFTDTMSVVVVSSKPYDFDFSLFGEDGENLLTETENGYEATIPTGTYSYGMDIYPIEHTQYELKSRAGFYTEIDRGAKSVFLPFSGTAQLAVTVPGGVHGDIVKNVTLNVIKPKDAVLINGSADFRGIQLALGTTETQLFVECSGGGPKFLPANDSLRLTKSTNLGGGRYILDIAVDSSAISDNNAPFRIIAGGKEFSSLSFSFTEFAFSVTSDRSVETAEDGGRQVALSTGNAVSFYAVASSGAKGVAYTWEYTGSAEDLSVDESGAFATVTPAKEGEFVLKVTARYGESVIVREIRIFAVRRISVVQIARKELQTDRAARYTIAGMVYADDLTVTENAFPLTVYSVSSSSASSTVVSLAGDEIEYSVSDETVATVEVRGGVPTVIPKGTGKVTIAAEWKFNSAFQSNVREELTVDVVKDAVAVKNAPELVKATEDGKVVVLTENIKLGTDAAGTAFSLEQRNEYLRTHRFKSTYNIEWYKNTKDATENDAYLSYVLEFKNDVYGNGKSIDADNFTHALDNTGKPLLSFYRGPLYFVNYKQTASVAGQDNCAFLVRTNDVKLYGVNLLGCSDDSLLNAEGGYDLVNLNLTGTTLEINADCEIVNCRIRNGRNVVRAYGGNRNGDHYFVDSLTANASGVDSERIHVTIEGCILSQGREFLLKVGANRALRASKVNSQEPALLDQNGKAYAESGKSNRYGDGKLYEDDWFYTHYVMTDVTLKDSVLETSGLFTVGIESNFSGEFLYERSTSTYATDDWERSGGTSFASVLRLEGDVRLYDWKDLALVDSSTLIESPAGVLSAWLNLDIKGMLDFVSTKDPTVYGNVIETTSDGKQFVHGGIALYGGGRNYSAVDLSALNKELADLMYLHVNISVLSEGDGAMQEQGSLLPRAAGTHDFNFYMYGKNSQNNYAAQRTTKDRYEGVKPVPLF